MKEIKHVLFEISYTNEILFSYLADIDQLPLFEDEALVKATKKNTFFTVRTSVYTESGALLDTRDHVIMDAVNAVKHLNDFSNHLTSLKDQSSREAEPQQLSLLP